MSDKNREAIHTEDHKIRNEVDKAIRLIKSNTGYGNILILIIDGKAVNIKTTLSTELK